MWIVRLILTMTILARVSQDRVIQSSNSNGGAGLDHVHHLPSVSLPMITVGIRRVGIVTKVVLVEVVALLLYGVAQRLLSVRQTRGDWRSDKSRLILAKIQSATTTILQRYPDVFGHEITRGHPIPK